MRLYNDLPHPPATYIGDRYDFREADGSLNNVNLPHIGKAGHAYTRSVQGKTAMPQSELPDPDLIFEALLKRERFVPHPAGNSSLMFGCAIHFMSIPLRTSLTPQFQLRHSGHPYPLQDQTCRRLGAERDVLIRRPVSSVW